MCKLYPNPSTLTVGIGYSWLDLDEYYSDLNASQAAEAGQMNSLNRQLYFALIFLYIEVGIAVAIPISMWIKMSWFKTYLSIIFLGADPGTEERDIHLTFSVLPYWLAIFQLFTSGISVYLVNFGWYFPYKEQRENYTRRVVLSTMCICGTLIFIR